MNMRALDGWIRAQRARLGTKNAVACLLLPAATFGCLYFGKHAFLVLVLSVALSMFAGILSRIIDRKPFSWWHPGSVVTGLLIGLTLRQDTPIYMIVIGAFVAAFVGKLRIAKFRKNLLNPAALGRGAIAVFEWLDPTAYRHGTVTAVDAVARASVLFKDAGGYSRPEFVREALLGLHPGAIGETNKLILLVAGFMLLRYVVAKREAVIAMILTVPLFVYVLPPSVQIIAHAPWVQDPLLYLFGGSTFLTAFFFNTDPVTTPKARLGGWIFGVGVALIGVVGKFYTSVPGFEMYGVLAMNILTPALDRWTLAESRSGTAASSKVQLP